MEPRREGFFYMKGSPTNANATTTYGGVVVEGVDANNIPSSRVTDHPLHFSVRRSGYRRTSHFGVGPFLSNPFTRYTAQNPTADTYYAGTDPVTGGAFVTSQWAEIGYVMRPMAGTPTPATPETAANAKPVQLYNLYRAEVMMLPYRDGNLITGITGTLTLDGQLGSVYLPRISNNLVNFLSPNDVCMSTTRGFSPTAATPNGSQVSLLCSNVVSFQVRAPRAAAAAPSSRA